MSQDEQDRIYGRVSREYGELEKQVASLVSKLKAIGVMSRILGQTSRNGLTL